MSKSGKTGVTTNTPKNIAFGAGTIHKNVDETLSNLDTTIIGATSGGSKISIKPEIQKIDADGALVAVKGLEVKVGETATMEINFLEMTSEILKSSIIGKDGTSNTNYNVIESKAKIESGDYFDNIAFVGETLDGRNIIVVMENALCTSGFEADNKNKDATVGTYTFECHADLTSDLDTLPYHIYFPKPKA